MPIFLQMMRERLNNLLKYPVNNQNQSESKDSVISIIGLEQEYFKLRYSTYGNSVN